MEEDSRVTDGWRGGRDRKVEVGMRERELFYQKLIGSKDLEGMGLDVGQVLGVAVALNLLCENEAAYFEQAEFNELSGQDTFKRVQSRAIHHRAEELLIKGAKGARGGFIKLFNGTRIEGSSGVGGAQPDYIVDSLSEAIQDLLREARRRDDSSAPEWDRVEAVGSLLRERIAKTSYDDPVYLALLSDRKEAGLEVPLSDYLAIGRGVCREMAMLTTLCLNHIGFDAAYYYARVERGSGAEREAEDHAVVAAWIDGELFSVDNYFRAYHRHRLESLQSHEGVVALGGTRYDPMDQEAPAPVRIIDSRLYPSARHHPKAGG